MVNKCKFQPSDSISYEFSVDTIHSSGIDYLNREIFITGEPYLNQDLRGEEEPGIDFSMAATVIKNVRILSNQSDLPILIHMKTCGGDVVEGLAIYDAIKLSPCPTTILNYTHARSMSSVIFQAADHRVMMPNSYFMIHEGTFGIEHTYKGVKSAIEFSKRWHDKNFFQIYIDRMKEAGKFEGKSEATIKRWIDSRMDKYQEVYLTPEETIELGLADEVFDGNWESLTDF